MTSWTEHTIETARGARAVRVFGKRSPGAPVVLHLHGGAFTGGSLDTSLTVPTLLARAGAVAVSADYPLAPQHPFPHALEAMFDLLGALQKCCAEWASRRSEIFVAGEEAGGNLAAGLALMARDRRAPLAGQILLSPMLDPLMGTCSLRSAEAGAVGCPFADGWHAYLGSPEKAAHPYAAPFGASRLAGVAPALLLTTLDDPLRDESETYARRLREAGVRVQLGVLTATGWPAALSVPADEAADEAPFEFPWASDAVAQFKQFFAAAAAARRPVASAHSMLV